MCCYRNTYLLYRHINPIIETSYKGISKNNSYSLVERSVGENRLRKHYNNMVGKLDELIPNEWREVVMYVEELGTVRVVQP